MLLTPLEYKIAITIAIKTCVKPSSSQHPTASTCVYPSTLQDLHHVPSLYYHRGFSHRQYHLGKPSFHV